MKSSIFYIFGGNKDREFLFDKAENDDFVNT